MLNARNSSMLKRVAGLMMLCAALSCAAQASAEPAVIALSEAVDIAKKAYSGKVVKADPLILETGLAYRIRLVNNGHVKEVLVDAISGELLPP